MSRDWTHPPKLKLVDDSLPLHEFVARWSETIAAPCLCGGIILANPIDPGPGVLAHQSTPQHAEWAAKVYG